jgi:hypothetical protein
MDSDTHSIDIIELVNKATELVNDASNSAFGQMVVQRIMIGERKYFLSVVIEVINEDN